jgi:hypothetical protein
MPKTNGKYDPGKPCKIRSLGDGKFAQETWRSEKNPDGTPVEYQQDLNRYSCGDCDCMHFRNRLMWKFQSGEGMLRPCKHLILAWECAEQMEEVTPDRLRIYKEYSQLLERVDNIFYQQEEQEDENAGHFK